MDNANRRFVDLDLKKKICHFLNIPNKNKLVRLAHNWNNGIWEDSFQTK